MLRIHFVGQLDCTGARRQWRRRLGGKVLTQVLALNGHILDSSMEAALVFEWLQYLY
jgi:hypothetical protein